MKLKITNLKIAGTVPNDEQVEIEVLDGTNLNGYALLDNTYKGGVLSNVYRHFYQLPNVAVKTGDKVIVHTGKGTYVPPKRVLALPVTHHLYVGSDSFIWNNSGDTAFLIQFALESKYTKPKYVTRLPKPFGLK